MYVCTLYILYVHLPAWPSSLYSHIALQVVCCSICMVLVQYVACLCLYPPPCRFLVPPTAAPPLGYMEVVEGQLHLYGIHALKAVHAGELECPVGSVKGVTFHFVAFSDVVPLLSTLGTVFPAVKVRTHACITCDMCPLHVVTLGWVNGHDKALLNRELSEHNTWEPCANMLSV